MDSHEIDFYDAVDQLAELHGSFEDFLQQVEGLFRHDYGRWRKIEVPEKGADRLRLVTGGWSENEALVSALEGTLFHTMCWESSARGGAHEYLIDKKLFSWAPACWGEKLIPTVVVDKLHQLPDGRTRWTEERAVLRGVGEMQNRTIERRTVTASAWISEPSS